MLDLRAKSNSLIMKKLLLFFFIILSYTTCFAQPTVGLRHYDNNVSDGYTLFSPEKNTKVYLINNCGEKVNEWTFTERPGATCYLLENGNLLRAGKDAIEVRDWDNNVVWSYSLGAIGLNQHHDIEPLPNGNVLCLMTDLYTDTEMIAAGKDPATVDPSFKLDKIIELEPIGTNDANIVWEWKFMDHFIQDYDNTKPNFGVIVDHPELIDLNFTDNTIANLNSDYTHVNGIDYNADLNQIIMSARHLNEIYIIDHSTTTAEASGHTGGNSNMGGDILWRWGNPQVYGQGSDADQKLYLQHDSKWVTPGYADEGKITVFNNGGDGSFAFSSVHIITPEIIGGVYTKESDKFKPLDFEWSWNGSFLGAVMYEGKKSGGHSLPNGNFIICETADGQVSEITKTGTHLWSYKNPVGLNGTITTQMSAPGTNHTLFRAEKYPSNYPGFSGKDLTPDGIIENVNTVSANCIALLGVDEQIIADIGLLNPVKDGIITFSKMVHYDSVTIYDLQGKRVFQQEHFEGTHIRVDLNSGLYILRLEQDTTVSHQKLVVQ